LRYIVPSCVWQTASPARAFASQLASTGFVVALADEGAAAFAADAVAVADDAGRAGADAVTAATRAGCGIAVAGRGFTSTGIGGDAYVGAASAFAVAFAGFGAPADATVAGRTLAGGTAFGRGADAIARGAADATE
jgi:hypothetical protein